MRAAGTIALPRRPRVRLASRGGPPGRGWNSGGMGGGLRGPRGVLGGRGVLGVRGVRAFMSVSGRECPSVGQPQGQACKARIARRTQHQA